VRILTTSSIWHAVGESFLSVTNKAKLSGSQISQDDSDEQSLEL